MSNASTFLSDIVSETLYESVILIALFVLLITGIFKVPRASQ